MSIRPDLPATHPLRLHVERQQALQPSFQPAKVASYDGLSASLDTGRGVDLATQHPTFVSDVLAGDSILFLSASRAGQDGLILPNYPYWTA